MDEAPRAPRPDDAAVAELFGRYTRVRSRAVRNEIVEMHMGLAKHISRRFSRGNDGEDLEQVALLALVRAVDRFDPERGFAFSTFAGRTIEGELKRYFRDRTWKVRVPRSLKDLRVSVRSASDELTNRLGRAPSVAEIAEFLDVETDSVVAALGADSARNTESIDAPAPGASEDDGPRSRSELATAGGFEVIDDRSQVEDLMRVLPEREREIVRLRFEGRLSQQAIAERMGLSQMHVSRLLRRSLETMREASEDQHHL